MPSIGTGQTMRFSNDTGLNKRASTFLKNTRKASLAYPTSIFEDEDGVNFAWEINEIYVQVTVTSEGLLDIAFDINNVKSWRMGVKNLQLPQDIASRLKTN